MKIDWEAIISTASQAQTDGFKKGRKQVKRIEIRDESGEATDIVVIHGDQAVATRIKNG